MIIWHITYINVNFLNLTKSLWTFITLSHMLTDICKPTQFSETNPVKNRSIPTYKQPSNQLFNE